MSTTKPSIILTLDVGSSSIRCSAHLTKNDCNQNIKTIKEYTIVRKLSSIRPNTGKIILHHRLCDDSSNTCETSEDSSILLMDEIDSCIDEILDKLGENVEVVGLGFSTFCMNLIGVDSLGQIIGEESTLSYACNDVRATNECEKLKKQLGGHKLHQLHQRTGSPLHVSYALPQLISYYSQNRMTNSRHQLVHKWQTLSSLCLSRWTGAFSSPSSSPLLLPISYSEASWTGLFNFHLCKWDEECTNELLDKEVRGALPDVVDYDDLNLFMEEIIDIKNYDAVERHKNKYWDRWPKLRSCRFMLGLGDGACANIGSKCSTIGRVAVTIGTSAAARVCVPLPIKLDHKDIRNRKKEKDIDMMVVPQGLFCYRINKSHVLLGGALTDGGSVVDWIRKLLNLKCEDDFELCLEHAMSSYKENVAQSKLTENVNDQEKENSEKEGQEFSPSNLSVIPFLSGERSTGFRGGAYGCILGLNRQSSPSDLIRACLEGVTLRIHAILTLISDAVDKAENPYCIVASGNGLERNLLWRQMLADCAGKQVVKDGDTNEATSRGVAMLVSLALYKDKGPDYELIIEETLNIVEAQAPNLSAKVLWNRLEKSLDASIQSVAPLWSR